MQLRIVVQVLGREYWLQVIFRNIKHPLDHAFLLGIEKQFGVGAVAQQQPDGAEHDGFTGAGFAGNNVEHRRWLHFQLLNQSVVLYFKINQHV